MKLIRKLGTRINENGHLESWAIFKCSHCLQEKEMRLSSGKRAKSCGCIPNNYKHGESYSKLYRVWAGMKKRCFNPKNKDYKDYGGRGITICPELTNDYIVFRDWALSNGYKENLLIDRINPNGNYEPSNCRWLTILESNRNKTNTITMVIANEIRSLWNTGNYTFKKLSKLFKLSESHIKNIIYNKRWKTND